MDPKTSGDFFRIWISAERVKSDCLALQFNRHMQLLKFLQRECSSKSRSIFKSLKHGDIAIDCGANVGEVVEKLVATGAHVYAFEPNPYAYRKLQERFGQHANLTCFNKAVGLSNCHMKLYMHDNAPADPILWSTGSSLLDFKKNINPNDFIEVEVIDFIQFLKEIGYPIKFIKMDIEGAECDIMLHLLESPVLSNIGVMYVETHEDKIPELRKKTEQIKEIVKQRNIRNIHFNWT